VVEVVEGPYDSGNDGKKAGEIEQERGESLLEGVWGGERSGGGDEAGGWQTAGWLVCFCFSVACA
jgi:hypothetical protein